MQLRATAAIVACVGVVGGVAGGARASTTNVVAAIRTQDKIIAKAPGYAELNGRATQPKTLAEVKKYVANIGRLEKVAAHAVSVVSQSSTTSAKQRAGKSDWIKGSKEQDRGLLKLQSAFRDLIAHNKTGFKKNFVASIKELAAGTKLGSKGDRLLGLPSRD